MSCSLFLLGGLAPLQSQEASTANPMWETILLTPDNTKLKVLAENMRQHNQKFHKEGSFNATVYTIASGPHTGKIIWMMGPLKFADLDKRPAAGGHDEDWRDNVMPYVKKSESGEYWRADDELSNTSMLSGSASEYPILYTRYWEINLEHGHNLDAHLKKISEAVKAMEGVNPWGVYDNLFRQGTKIGRHLATVSFLKNWAELDEDPRFKETFTKLNGEDSWDAFVRNSEQILDDSWDEIWVYDKNLSGD